jgi:hypothetical protein
MIRARRSKESGSLDLAGSAPSPLPGGGVARARGQPRLRFGEATAAGDLQARGGAENAQRMIGAPTLKEGLQRIVNGLDPAASPRLRVNRMTGGD